MSPSIGVGPPMIALFTQFRLDEFMMDASLEGHVFHTLDPDLREKLVVLANKVLAGPDPCKECFSRTRHEMRSRTRKLNQRMVDFVIDKLSA